MEEIINKFIFDVYGNESIKFVNAQGLESGADYDIYCVVNNSIKSEVKIFKYEDTWIEIFVDNWKDMEAKIKNADEICVSFIKKMNNYFDNEGSYLKAINLIPTKYKLLDKRKNLIYYRIKVLYSKFKSAKSEMNKKFFKGQIMPQLMLLAFDKIGIWPNSPKNWFEQLDNSKDDFVLNILKSQNIDTIFCKLCESEECKFSGIYLIKESENNQMTFLG